MRDPREVLTRPGPEPDVVLTYGPGPDQVCDVWWPRTTRAAALVLIIHGGFWQAEYDRLHVRPMAEGLVAAGYVVGSIEYARIGVSGGGWPGTFDDVADAVDRLPRMIKQTSPATVRPENPIIVGHSAGGQLALWAAARHRLPSTSAWHRDRPASVRGVVALAPVACLAEADRGNVGDGAVAQLLGGPARDHAERYRLVDPVELLPSGVPTVVLHGGRDRQVPTAQSRSYVATAIARGDRTTLVELADTEHFGFIDPLSGAWPAVLQAIAGLIGETPAGADRPRQNLG